MKQSDKIEVIVVGAGPSGLACAYTLAKAGVEVLVLERGEYPGAKNMFGGIFFSSIMEKFFPNFLEDAPWERFVGKRKFALLTGDSEMTFEMSPSSFNRSPFNHSFIARRGQMDQWFAKKVEEAGGNIIPNYCVRDFLYEKGKVVGITSGGDDDSFLADCIVCSEGANSLLTERAGLREKIGPEYRSIAVKENIRFSQSVLEDRFGVTGQQGAAYEYFGSSVKGLLGNGFIYTNKDSLSVGVGFSLSDFIKSGNKKTPHDILEEFKSHPSIAPLVRGGETVEYMAHMIPSDGYNRLPKFYRDGLLITGDAAGLLNTSFFHEGVNLAMQSGILAAETIIEARAKKNYSSENLSKYEEKLNASFILQDLKNCKNFLSFLTTHKAIINEYPALMNDILVEYFTVSEKPKTTIKKEIFNRIRKNVNIPRMASDMWGAWRNLV
ncbi:MAG: FAD-dependent oxidoreductase [Candidatus Omnitrophica bacterium]|nr:FAD-dependent oxidoreductase [Candidatus Omnitrophota bacterium]